MKALSIKQPWAWAICNLPLEFRKDIENRIWNTKFRGDFLIHTSKKFDMQGYDRMIDYLNQLGYKGNIPAPSEFTMGAIIGVSSLVNIANNYDYNCLDTKSIWYEEQYGFMLEDSKTFDKAIPYKGQLKFFNVDDELVRNEIETIIKRIPINQKKVKEGDVVTANPNSFDAISKRSKNTSGLMFFKTEHKIMEVNGDFCRFDDIGIGYSWYHKNDLMIESLNSNKYK